MGLHLERFTSTMLIACAPPLVAACGSSTPAGQPVQMMGGSLADAQSLQDSGSHLVDGNAGETSYASGDGSSDAMMDTGEPEDSGVIEGSVFPDGGNFHIPFPTVTLNGTGVMTDIKLVSIVASNDANGSDLLAFGDALVASQWWKTVAAPYGAGPFVSHTKLVGAAMNANMTEADVQTYIGSTLTAQGQPSPDSNTIYIVYLPEGIWILVDGQPNTDCNLTAGDHSSGAAMGAPIIWGYAQQCPMGSYLPGAATALQSGTQIASHEILEAATNPHGNDGWSLECAQQTPPGCTPWLWVPAYPGEVADLCAWSVTTEAGYAFTRAWSNAAAALGGDPCVPAANGPYVSATSEQNWYTIDAGQTLQIPAVGWATSASPPWQIYSYDGYDPKQEFTVLPSGYVPLGVGQSTTVSVSVASSAVSGDFAVVGIASYTSTEIHPWAVGVYVP